MQRSAAQTETEAHANAMGRKGKKRFNPCTAEKSSPLRTFRHAPAKKHHLEEGGFFDAGRAPASPFVAQLEIACLSVLEQRSENGPLLLARRASTGKCGVAHAGALPKPRCTGSIRPERARLPPPAHPPLSPTA